MMLDKSTDLLDGYSILVLIRLESTLNLSPLRLYCIKMVKFYNLFPTFSLQTEPLF